MGWQDQPAVDQPVEAGSSAPQMPQTSQMSRQPVAEGASTERNLGWGDTAADVGKSLASGALRGTAQLADLPGDLTQLAGAGLKYATGYQMPTFDTSFREGMSGITGGFSERNPETTAGRYAGTVGEFIPGAVGTALTGGGSLVGNVLRGAVAPALASEGLGQLASEKYSETPWVEPAARLAGAILGGAGANKIENFARGVISPGGGASASRLAAAKELRDKGVPITAGQATGRANIAGAEADTALGQAIAGAAPDSTQAKAFTGAVMKHLGSDEALATPAAMTMARDAIVKKMNDALSGVSVTPDAALRNNVNAAAKYYGDVKSVDGVRIINNAINRLRSKAPLDGEQLASWRSSLGDLLDHSDKGVRGSAYMLRDAIDQAIDGTMKNMGQPERMQAWKQSRDQYRNFLAAKDALKVTKDIGIEGIITPKDLMAALAKQDKNGIVTGSRGDVADLARAGISVMKPLPASGSHGLVDSAIRRVGPIAAAGGAGLGAMQLSNMAGLGPLATTIGTGAAMAKPFYEAGKDMVKGFSMSKIPQRYLENQLVNSTSGASGLGSAARSAAIGAPTYGADRTQRKSGGRVGGMHDRMADQLVGAAERAKKGISAGTEQLLEMPDDHIAHALDVANRSI